MIFEGFCVCLSFPYLTTFFKHKLEPRPTQYDFLRYASQHKCYLYLNSKLKSLLPLEMLSFIKIIFLAWIRILIVSLMSFRLTWCTFFLYLFLCLLFTLNPSNSSSPHLVSSQPTFISPFIVPSHQSSILPRSFFLSFSWCLIFFFYSC